MKTKLGLLGLVAGIALLSGCMSFNSGNLGHDVKPLPFEKGEEAVTTKYQKVVDTTTGNYTETIDKMTESGLAVNKQIQLKKLETARDVGVARADGGGTQGSFTPYGGTSGNGGGTQGSFTPYGGTSWR